MPTYPAAMYVPLSVVYYREWPHTSGDLSAFTEATQRYTGYLNRHLSQATEQVAILTGEKESLNNVNTMLAGKSFVWEEHPTLNAVIRAIAAVAFNHKYSAAWDRFYRELKYRTGIQLSRRSIPVNGTILDTVRDEEWPELMKVAASLCYDYCVNVVHITNKETVEAYGLDTVGTEFDV